MKNQNAKDTVRRNARPLSPKQRTYLTQLALRGWKRTGASAEEKFDDWRRRNAMKATELKNEAGEIVQGVTISTALKSDFDSLHLHFKTLAGEASLDDAADHANELRQLHHSISKLQRSLGLTDAYLAGIVKNITRGAYHWTTPQQGRAVLNALRYHAQRQTNA